MGKGGVLTLREGPKPNACKYLQTLAQLDTDLLKFTSSNTGGPCGDVAQGSPLMDRIWLFPGLKNTKIFKNTDLLNVDNKGIKATRWCSFSLQTIASQQSCMWYNKRNICNVYWTPLNTLEHICGSTASEMTPFPF